VMDGISPPVGADKSWTQLARNISDQYSEFRSSFGLLPWSGDPSELAKIPPAASGAQGSAFANTQFPMFALDAAHLGQVLQLAAAGGASDPGDKARLEVLSRFAAAGLYWLAGLHPGLPTEMTSVAATAKWSGPGAYPVLYPAAFIVNAPCPFALPERNRYYVRGLRQVPIGGNVWGDLPAMSTVPNGFTLLTPNGTPAWFYEATDFATSEPRPGWVNGESYLLHDGALLRAMVTVENLLNGVLPYDPPKA
jgi:hypothetical protein